MSLVTVVAGDILYQAWRYAGILRGPQRGLSGSESAEGIQLLNAMLDALQANRSWIWAIGQFQVPINANQQSYQIGQDTSGGIPDWFMPRPEVIQRAGFLYTNTNPVVEVAFEIYNDQQWAALSPKELTSTVPVGMYFRPTVPNGTVLIWPIPTQSWAANLYLWVTLQSVAGPDDVLQMPPAYNDALSYGLAVRIAPFYKESLLYVNPAAFGEVKAAAAAAMQRVRTINFPAVWSQAESGAMSAHDQGNYSARYNIISNQYNT